MITVDKTYGGWGLWLDGTPLDEEADIIVQTADPQRNERLARQIARRLAKHGEAIHQKGHDPDRPRGGVRKRKVG